MGIIKLKENCYIEYQKTSDTFGDKLLTKKQVEELVRKGFEVETYRNPKINVEKDTKNMMIWIESRGTSDLGGGVDLAFVLKYNQSGPQERPLTLKEIFEKYKYADEK